MNVQTMKKEVIMLPTIVNNLKTLLEINKENIQKKNHFLT